MKNLALPLLALFLLSGAMLSAPASAQTMDHPAAHHHHHVKHHHRHHHAATHS